MNHAGMVPVIATADQAVDGVFTLPFEWTMAGDWSVEASLALASGEMAKATVAVTIAGAEASMAGMDHAATTHGESSAVYMRIVNSGDSAKTFVTAHSPAAKRVEFHQTAIVDDMASMRPLQSLVIPAGASLHLRPGGLHIMLRELAHDLEEGSELELKLVADDGETIALSLPIMSMWLGDAEAETVLGDLSFSQVWARPASGGMTKDDMTRQHSRHTD